MRRALFSFPVTLRLGLEFDTADIQQPWWLPWFHSWHTEPSSERFSLGCRVGVLGLHLVVGVTVFNDEFAGDLASAFFDERDELTAYAACSSHVDGPVVIAHREQCRTNQPGFKVGDGCTCDFGARLRAHLEADE